MAWTATPRSKHATFHGWRVHTLHTGVQDAMAEVLALHDFLDDVIGVHPSGVHSLQLIFHWILLHWGSESSAETADCDKCQLFFLQTLQSVCVCVLPGRFSRRRGPFGCRDGGSGPALPLSPLRLLIALFQDAADAGGGRPCRDAASVAQIRQAGVVGAVTCGTGERRRVWRGRFNLALCACVMGMAASSPPEILDFWLA